MNNSRDDLGQQAGRRNGPASDPVIGGQPVEQFVEELANAVAWRRRSQPVPGRAAGRESVSASNWAKRLPPTVTRPLRPANKEGFKGGDACPDLLTEEESIRYLRLDLIDIKNPRETLQTYRKLRLLRGTQISKKVFYLRSELDELLKKVTAENPR